MCDWLQILRVCIYCTKKLGKVLLLEKSVPACVDSFWIATSCSWMVWFEKGDYCLLLFYRELMNHLSFCVGKQFIRHSRVSQSPC
ncbi:hypothetical protein MtrunA17_Chr8g0339831 [Medicago truncatula]|uniref:Uncharacterized protein n=1 Tax=Medicago truncatula TaxID=3880 RepID=A0A396GE69_MEDTR|nr:hypothetical protein MtrunA17_Chr8g0339831 [Medicago truncatula]